MRLIDADALREELDSILNWNTNDEYNMYSDTMVAIDNAHTIEAEPVRHGHWIPQYVSSRGNTDTFSCSECNANSYTTHMVKSCHYKYCRNCGAKMDK